MTALVDLVGDEAHLALGQRLAGELGGARSRLAGGRPVERGRRRWRRRGPSWTGVAGRRAVEELEVVVVDPLSRAP